MLFVDAGNNRVGIGDSTPSQTLTVVSSDTNASRFYGSGGHGLYSYHDGGGTGWATGAGTSYDNLLYLDETNDKIELYTGGLKRFELSAGATVFNEIGADTDFRVESDTNSHAFFVNAGGTRIGMGNTDNATAHLNVDGNITGGYGGIIRMNNSGTSGCMGFIGVTDTNWAVGAGKLILGTGSQGANTGSGLVEMEITPGAVAIDGALSKGSGSFKISHPLPEKNETHHLVHSFVEAPQADNIYRGKIDLVAGQATVNIDTVAGMTEGTFAALNREIQCFTSNETGWTAVRGSVTGNILTIEAQDNTCADTISWLVIGERQDQHMYDTGWTDENGKVIVEPLKEQQPN
jgi:hypothetical protein